MKKHQIITKPIALNVKIKERLYVVYTYARNVACIAVLFIKRYEVLHLATDNSRLAPKDLVRAVSR